jgi:hypothetical protein
MGFFKDCGCGCNGSKQKKKFMIAMMSALIFFVVANPQTYRVVRRILGPVIASPTGCPTQVGVFIHSVVFLLVTWGMMNIKKEDYTIDESPSEVEFDVSPSVQKLPISQIKKGPVPEINISPASSITMKEPGSLRKMEMGVEQPRKIQTKKPNMIESQVNKQAPTPGVFDPEFQPLDGTFSVGCIDLNHLDKSY